MYRPRRAFTGSSAAMRPEPRRIQVLLLRSPTKVLRSVVERVFVDVNDHIAARWRRSVECFADHAMNLHVPDAAIIVSEIHMSGSALGGSDAAKRGGAPICSLPAVWHGTGVI